MYVGPVVDAFRARAVTALLFLKSVAIIGFYEIRDGGGAGVYCCSSGVSVRPLR